MNAQRQFVLGVFFVIALSTLAFYTLFLTEFSLFGEPIQITADFPEAHHLREGDPVLVAGKRIGRVKEITYHPDRGLRRIQVVMNLDQEIEILTGYRIAIEESTFLGGRNVDIDPGPGGAPPLVLPPGEAYLGVVQRNPIAALQEVGNLITDNSDSVTSFFRSLDLILLEVRKGEGAVGRAIYDPKLGEDLVASVADFRATVENARAISDQVRSGEGNLGKLVYDESLYQTFRSTVESLQTIAADLQQGRGVLGALIYDDPLAEELRSVVKNFDAFSADLSELTDGVQAGEGLVGRLMKDPELARSLDETITNFRVASEDLKGVASAVRGTDGSLGKLINDPELYDEALIALRLLTRSLEDYREAAPVSGFTSVLFGAF